MLFRSIKNTNLVQHSYSPPSERQEADSRRQTEGSSAGPEPQQEGDGVALNPLKHHLVTLRPLSPFRISIELLSLYKCEVPVVQVSERANNNHQVRR